MSWWFLILGLSAVVLVCAVIALIARVNQHMRDAKAGSAAAEVRNDKDKV
jgi:hypothetical protein